MEIVLVLLGLFVLVLAFSFVAAYPAMLLWNGCLVPAVTFCNEVTWLQMFGLVILFSMLFKSASVSQSK